MLRCRCPAEYGPYMALFNRWSRKGIWPSIYAALIGDERTPRHLLADRTHIKARRRSAAGAEKGANNVRRLVAPAAVE